MTLFAILIGLVLDRYIDRLPEWRHYGLVKALAGQVHRLPGATVFQGVVGVLLTLLPFVLIVALIQSALDHGWLLIPGLLFGIACLVYGLGPRDLDRDIDAYQDACSAGIEEAAVTAAANVISGHVPDKAEDRHRAMVEAVLAEANERLFAVIFWFALLGPVGAVLFRGASELRNVSGYGDWGEYHPAAARLHDLLAWLPARVLAAGYALSGHFEGAVQAWRHLDERRPSGVVHGGAEFLAIVGSGALDMEPDETAGLEDIDAATGLVWRAIIMIVVVIALLTLAGWAS